MLQKLYIKNYALIDTLDIHFDRGLNIITGETGAGKSIMMGALGLILGNRVDGKHFFNDKEKCVIEGYFAVGSYALKGFFMENDLEYEEETIIRREISSEGKSRAFVNDSPVNLQTLKLLAERLIDIHSQHATLQINTEEFQFLVLDSVANHADMLQQYRAELQHYKKVKQDLKELEESSAQSNAELDYNQFVFNELETAQLSETEVSELEKEQQQLENAEDIKRALLAIQHRLEESEQPVLTALRDSLQDLQRVSSYIQGGNELTERLNSSLLEIKDIAAEISSLEQNLSMDETRLQFVSDRLSVLYSLFKKYRVADTAELILFKNEIEEKIQSVQNQEETIAKKQKELLEQQTQLTQLAHVISKNRIAKINEIQNAVRATLTKVGMPNAVLQINLTPTEHFTNYGMDRIEFLFSANKGQQVQAIHKVASGGELSRVMLSIKSLIAKSSALPTIIFDEIDTGISGEVALQVGEVMESLATNMQVIAITHLPQIASKGNKHFKVFKEDRSDRTQSRIEALASEERVLEVAKMLSGANPGDAALQHARELLGN